jgi:hypothetical protein
VPWGQLGDAHGLKHDRAPVPLEATDHVTLECLAVASGDNVSALLLGDAGRVVRQVGGDAEDRVLDGDRIAPPRRQAPVLRVEEGPLGPAGRPSLPVAPCGVR